MAVAIDLASLALCLATTLAIVGAMAQIVGGSPERVLGAIIEGAFGSTRAIIETVREATPIVLGGLAFLIPLRAGFFNIGAQGQLQIGALASVFVTTTLTLPPPLTVLLAMLFAMLAGALLILPALVLKTTCGASEVTTTVMLNSAAAEFVLAMVTGPMKEQGSFIAESPLVPYAHRLPGGDVHLGVYLALAIAIIAAWILKKTVFGFRLKALGGNQAASEAVGIRADITLAQAVLAAGAIAGLAGGVQVLGIVFQVAEQWAKPWGFVGILAALIGRSPLGVLLAALFLAGLETGGRHMQAMSGVPSALFYLMQALPVLFYLTIRAARPIRALMDAGAGGRK